MKLAYEKHGSGFPVVLLHAFPLSRAMWRGNIDAVTSAGYSLILPDLPGFGESRNFSDINTMADMAADVAELLDDLKIESAVIGGLSMGGYTTFELLRSREERFAGLILCDTTSDADTDEKRQGRMDTIELIESDGAQALVDNMLPKLVGETTKANDPWIVNGIAEMVAAVDPKAAIAAMRGMAARRDNGEILANVDVPTLLIFGEEDQVTNLSAAKNLNDSIKDSKLVVIPSAGHLSNIEQPAAFNTALKNFLEQLGK